MKRLEKRPGCVLRAAINMLGMFLLGMFVGGLTHYLVLIAFLSWLFHQCNCCWRRYCVFCHAAKDFSVWAIKRYRRISREGTSQGRWFKDSAHTLIVGRVQEQVKDFTKLHRLGERLLKKTIPIYFRGYCGEGRSGILLQRVKHIGASQSPAEPSR